MLKRESYHEKANKYVNIIHTRKNAYAWAKDNTKMTQKHKAQALGSLLHNTDQTNGKQTICIS